MRRLVFLLVAVLLSGCAAHQLTPERASQIKTIGGVSLIDPVKLELVPPFLPNGWVKAAQGDELSLASFVVRQVTEQLEARYDVRPVIYDPAKLVAPAPWQLGHGVILLPQPDITSLLAQGLDAYVVVMPATIMEPGKFLTQRQIAYLGLGLVRFEGLLSDQAFGVHAPYLVLVMDGTTGSKIASQFGDPAALWRVVDQSWWADSFDAMSDQQKQRLREAIEQMIAATLPSALARTRLIPEQASSLAK